MAEDSELDQGGKRQLASERVADALQARIARGELASGDSLPTYRQLADDFAVAVNTAIAAVRILRDRGLVNIRRNAGATVRDAASSIDVAAELADVSRELDGLRAALRDANQRLQRAEQKLAEVGAAVAESDR